MKNRIQKRSQKGIDFLIDFSSILGRFLVDFGLPNRSKIDSKANTKATSIQDGFQDRFCMDFLSIFGLFWERKSLQNRLKINPKTITNSITKDIIFLLFFYRFSNHFEQKINQKSYQKRSAT